MNLISPNPPSSRFVPRGRCRRRGFTLIEATVAISLTAMASAVLLLSFETSLQTTDDALFKTIAIGLAEQLMDEILGQPYHDAGSTPHQTSLGPEAGEYNLSKRAPSRTSFDDTDDYNQFASWPPVDEFGIEFGQGDGNGETRHPSFQGDPKFFDNWYMFSTVRYVSESDPTRVLSNGQTSNYRAVEVNVYRKLNNQWKQLTKLRRVFAYVPAPPSS